MPDGDKKFRGSLVFDYVTGKRSIYIYRNTYFCTQYLLYPIIHLGNNKDHKTEPSVP